MKIPSTILQNASWKFRTWMQSLHGHPDVLKNSSQLYGCCKEAYDNNIDVIVDEIGLPDTFQTWFSITHLHVWMLLTRFRPEKMDSKFDAEGNRRLDGDELSHALTDEFFFDVEPRMNSFGITHGSTIKRTTKEMGKAFLGGSMAYDEGLYKGDAVLAAALWRNLCGSQGQLQNVYRLTEYTQRTLYALDRMETVKVMKGDFKFTPIKL